MIISNKNGLTTREFEKVLRPYARNSGKPVDFRRAGQAAVQFLQDNPNLLRETGELLDEVQQ